MNLLVCSFQCRLGIIAAGIQRTIDCNFRINILRMSVMQLISHQINTVNKLAQNKLLRFQTQLANNKTCLVPPNKLEQLLYTQLFTSKNI